MKINEDHPNENGLFPQSRGVGHLHVLWWKLKAGKRRWEQREGFKCAQIGLCWREEAAGRLPGCILWAWFGERIWFPLVGPELESGAELGGAGCHWASPHFAENVLVWLLQLAPAKVVGHSVQSCVMWLLFAYVTSLSISAKKKWKPETKQGNEVQL